MNLDRFLLKRHDAERYNCAHFACDVWQAVTGEDLRRSAEGFLLPPEERYADLRLLRLFERSDTPTDPCLVLFRRPGLAIPHLGVFTQGRVIHLNERGVERMPPSVAGRGFTKIDYYWRRPCL